MRAPLIALSMLLTVACRNKDAAEIDTASLGSDDDPVDADADGYDSSEDCDDANSLVSPGAEEICDGADNNCDGVVDEGVTSTFYADSDDDGFGDEASTVAACELPDGHAAVGNDCDDGDADSYPGAAERCDGTDNDCDGAVDEDVLGTWYADADGDGYGDLDSAYAVCDPPPGYVSNADDCDDTDGASYPGGGEVCDEADNDCDGTVDEDVTTTYYQDADGDSFGVADTTTEACVTPGGYAVASGDCDDADATVSPNATELCDSVDNDCDGAVDEDDAADAPAWYDDDDSDGYGDAGDTTRACGQPSGYVADRTDCDDTTAEANPGAAEVCDTIDNDCDGEADEDSATDAATWYADNDGDGYGGTSSTTACTQPSGFADNSDDCDDGEPSANPGEAEVCDAIDNDCDGDTDEDVTTTYYLDYDGDGFGDASRTTEGCSAPASYTDDATDCDDLDAAINADAAEVCDAIDNDCDGAIDDDDSDVDTSGGEVYYADADEDGFGDPDSTTAACTLPDGYTSDDTDCDDTDAATNPDGEEICDGEDNDCDGSADDGQLGGSEDCAAESCDAILQDGSSTGDGDYYLDPDGDGAAELYTCDMTTDGGGWTLVAEWDRVNNGDTVSDFTSLMTERYNNMYLWAERSTYLEWADYDLDADVMAYRYDVEVPNGGEGWLDLDFDGYSMECSGVWFFLQDTSGSDTNLACREDLSTASACNSTGHGSSYYTTTEQSYEPGYTCSLSANTTWTWSSDFTATASTEIDSFNIVGMMFDAYGDKAYLYRFVFWVR